MSPRKPLISPSLLSADFLNLGESVKMICESEADWLHIDVMDGEFVPNISFGFPVIEAINRVSSKPLDVHLMIREPDRYLERFKGYPLSLLTVHFESCIHLHRTIQVIKSLGFRAGVALNPHTPTSVLQDIIHEIDVVLLMSVNPGFGGQKFIHNTYKKIVSLEKQIIEAGSNTLIEIDGGVDISNAGKLMNAGANILVAGNAIFSAEDPKKYISGLKSLCISEKN